ncbi:hypothetical protein DYGSA30_38640 [Dyella sp. GSA-30]|nr:hypothetical protein DYGSA30_38640 [Dyella sp. GSA-30]
MISNTSSTSTSGVTLMVEMAGLETRAEKAMFFLLGERALWSMPGAKRGGQASSAYRVASLRATARYGRHDGVRAGRYAVILRYGPWYPRGLNFYTK